MLYIIIRRTPPMISIHNLFCPKAATEKFLENVNKWRAARELKQVAPPSPSHPDLPPPSAAMVICCQVSHGEKIQRGPSSGSLPTTRDHEDTRRPHIFRPFVGPSSVRTGQGEIHHSAKLGPEWCDDCPLQPAPARAHRRQSPDGVTVCRVSGIATVSHIISYQTLLFFLLINIFQLDVALEEMDTQRNGLVFVYNMSNSKYSNFDYELSQKMLTLLKGEALTKSD